MRRLVPPVAVLAVLVTAALGLRVPEASISPSPRLRSIPQPTPKQSPPKLSAVAIDRQDRVTRAHRDRETRAFDERPLLALLPLELAGVRIEISGLAADGRRTILRVYAGPRTAGFATTVYRRALSAAGDDGAAYELRLQP